MKLAGSILDLKPKTKQEVLKLQKSGLDYIHIDVMDGKFVPNISLPYNEVINLVSYGQIYDVHLMVEDVKDYVDEFCKIQPKFIIFHLEIGNTMELIHYIKNKNIKVGLSIKPNTNIELLEPYLKLIDVVLVMSVEPGLGGQKFIENSSERIEYLYEYREDQNLNYQIAVDGGIHDQIIPKLKKCDIIVVGSFITKGNYIEQIKKVKGAML